MQAISISAPVWARIVKIAVALGAMVLVGVSLYNHQPLIATSLTVVCLAGFGVTRLRLRASQGQLGKHEALTLSAEPHVWQDNEAIIVVLDFENEKLAQRLTCITQSNLTSPDVDRLSA
jgi:hypothetical protein